MTDACVVRLAPPATGSSSSLSAAVIIESATVSSPVSILATVDASSPALQLPSAAPDDDSSSAVAAVILSALHLDSTPGVSLTVTADGSSTAAQPRIAGLTGSGGAAAAADGAAAAAAAVPAPALCDVVMDVGTNATLAEAALAALASPAAGFVVGASAASLQLLVEISALSGDHRT